jgi:hypothetical protein
MAKPSIYFLRIEVELLMGREVWDRRNDRLCVPWPPQEHALRNRHGILRIRGR